MRENHFALLVDERHYTREFHYDPGRDSLCDERTLTFKCTPHADSVPMINGAAYRGPISVQFREGAPVACDPPLWLTDRMQPKAIHRTFGSIVHMPKHKSHSEDVYGEFLECNILSDQSVLSEMISDRYRIKYLSVRAAGSWQVDFEGGIIWDYTGGSGGNHLYVLGYRYTA